MNEDSKINKIIGILIMVLIVGNIAGWSLFATRVDTIREYQKQVKDLQYEIEILQDEIIIKKDWIYTAESDLNQMREALYPLYRSGEVELTEEQEWILTYPITEAEMWLEICEKGESDEAKEAARAWREKLDYLRERLEGQ